MVLLAVGTNGRQRCASASFYLYRPLKQRGILGLPRSRLSRDFGGSFPEPRGARQELPEPFCEGFALAIYFPFISSAFIDRSLLSAGGLSLDLAIWLLSAAVSLHCGGSLLPANAAWHLSFLISNYNFKSLNFESEIKRS